MVSYSEKLRDPRWQKKRLEIFNRDNWECQKCGEKEKELHIHHKEYIYGLEPWEYSDKLIITYCAECHKKTHSEKMCCDKTYRGLVRKRFYRELKNKLNLPPYEDLWKFCKKIR